AFAPPPHKNFKVHVAPPAPVRPKRTGGAPEGGGTRRPEPFPPDPRRDPRERVLPPLPVGGEEVTGSRGRIELHWHDPMVPDTGRPRHVEYRSGSRLRLAAGPRAAALGVLPAGLDGRAVRADLPPHLELAGVEPHGQRRFAALGLGRLFQPVLCLRPAVGEHLGHPAQFPPTSDLKPAPICEPTCRDRTVIPNTSPRTSVTSYPGRSFMVERI